jgi:hypothetical protein
MRMGMVYSNKNIYKLKEKSRHGANSFLYIQTNISENGRSKFRV